MFLQCQLAKRLLDVGRGRVHRNSKNREQVLRQANVRERPIPNRDHDALLLRECNAHMTNGIRIKRNHPGAEASWFIANPVALPQLLDLRGLRIARRPPSSVAAIHVTLVVVASVAVVLVAFFVILLEGSEILTSLGEL